jgi:hypothetical protein
MGEQLTLAGMGERIRRDRHVHDTRDGLYQRLSYHRWYAMGLCCEFVYAVGLPGDRRVWS